MRFNKFTPKSPRRVKLSLNSSYSSSQPPKLHLPLCPIQNKTISQNQHNKIRFKSKRNVYGSFNGNSYFKRNNNNFELEFNGEPYLPSFILFNFCNILMKFEENEIQNYSQVFFIRRKKPSQFNDFYRNFYNEPGEHIAYRYEILEELGRGSFGIVLKCFDHMKRIDVAIKIIKDDHENHPETVMEYNIMKKLHDPENITINNFCPYIANLYESFSFRGFFCIVMEFIENNSLLNQSYDSNKFCIRELFEALKYIHSNGIIHCDIKPNNVLISRDHRRRDILRIKVIDFGCSCFIGKTLYSHVQSRNYRAPEIVFGLPYNELIDIWSAGCVAFEAVTGKYLFDTENENELIQQIIETIGMPPQWMIENGNKSTKFFNENGNFISNNEIKNIKPGSYPLDERVGFQDKQLLLLLKSCLAWDPIDRLSASQIVNHKWFS